MTEEILQRQVAGYLDMALPSDCVWFHVPNGGHRNKVVAAKLKAQGVKPGVADIILMSERSVDCVELKTEKGRLSKEQKDFRDRVTALGWNYAICRSLDDLYDTLDEWGYRLKVRPV